MEHRVVTVQFSRDGKREGLELDPAREYLARIDGGPQSTFVVPWTQNELELLVERLRNMGEEKPTTQYLRQVGMQLGSAIHQINGMEAALTQRGNEQITVYWQLDYPELARIPWELATRNQPPHHHLLDEDISFVRTVPAVTQDAPAQWPTGLNQSLRLLFIWGESAPDDVPHKTHRPALESICEEYGIEFVAQEISSVSALTDLCADSKSKPFHFVHILAHGAAKDGNWGLRLKDEIAEPEQIAKALRAGGKTPAIVTVAACDSANDKDNSFGSVAYQLHAYGVPFVVASQFRLRKSASNISTAMVYEELLKGGDLREMIKRVRLRLAPNNNEAWANEVVYSSYRYESLEELAVIARQQGALRRADTIVKKAGQAENAEKKAEFIAALDEETERLRDLIERLKKAGAAPPALAETYGLLGSLLRRKALLRSDPPDDEDLRHACAYYQDGMRADANSHYCGINVVHLSLRTGDQEIADQYIPLVRFAALNQIDRDYWAQATAGELEVYAQNKRQASNHYREFARAVEAATTDKGAVLRSLLSSKAQLDEIIKVFADIEPIRTAAESAVDILAAAIARNS